MSETNTNQDPGLTPEAFMNAEESLHKLTETTKFADACVQAGVDPLHSGHTESYWNLVAQFAVDEVAEKRANGDSSLDVAAFELLSLTPAFIHAERALTQHQASGAERQLLRQKTSYFNSVLRDLGANYPGVKASITSQAMMNICGRAGLGNSDTHNHVRNTVRGAQHELGFGQILGHTGFDFEPAPLELDLRGADYVLHAGTDEDMLIDVKASLSEIEALGGEGSPFAIRSKHRQSETPGVVMFSLIQDKEFGDEFLIPDELAAQKATALIPILFQAKQARDAA